MKITAASLKEMIAEQVRESMGASNDAEVKALREELDAMKAKNDEIQRKRTQDGFVQNTATDYQSKAAHVIRGDVHKGVGLRFGRFVRVLALGAKSHRSPQDIALAWGDKWLADDIDKALQQKLTEGTLAAGGAIVPNEYINEVIELLRSEAVMRLAGATILPMRTGSMTIPRQIGAATATYTGEKALITESNLSLDDLAMTGKKLTALTPLSNELLADSDPAVDKLVRDDLVAVMALREDLAFLRDDGSVNKPKGLTNQMATANKFDRGQASAPSTLAEINADLFKAVRQPKAANIKLRRGAWIGTTRTMFGLMQQLDSNGNYVFRDEMLGGKLLGWPIFEENQIPENLKAGDETELYFAEMTECIIGDVMDLAIEVFPNGAYHDGSAVVSGISTDQTVVRAISRHDFGLRHPEAASLIEAIDWGV